MEELSTIGGRNLCLPLSINSLELHDMQRQEDEISD